MNEPNPTAAILLYVLGGLAGAVFYLPFKKVKNWAWESYWLVYAVAGLVVVPWVLAFIVSPKVCGLLSSADLKMLALCFVFGAMWGFGGLTWGLMIRYLGVGLGLAVGCGLCASAGTLIPPLFRGELGGFLRVASGQATLLGVAIALLGIVMVGMAGMSKEKELPEEQKKKAVAEFDFKKGMLVAIFSGVMSAGMAFGLGSGGALEKAAVAAGTSPTWQGIPVLVVVLLGGFTVNLVWCLYLNLKNKTTGDYSRKDAPRAANVVFAGLAGLIWCLQFITYKVADSKIGEFGFAGWTVFMSSMIIFSTLLGIGLGEWKGVSSRTKRLLGASLGVLVASLLIIGYGNKLKAGETKTPASAAVPAAARTQRAGRGAWANGSRGSLARIFRTSTRRFINTVALARCKEGAWGAATVSTVWLGAQKAVETAGTARRIGTPR
jgi:L-rhamnose-H+ transport protein